MSSISTIEKHDASLIQSIGKGSLVTRAEYLYHFLSRLFHFCLKKVLNLFNMPTTGEAKDGNVEGTEAVEDGNTQVAEGAEAKGDDAQEPGYLNKVKFLEEINNIQKETIKSQEEVIKLLKETIDYCFLLRSNY